MKTVIVGGVAAGASTGARLRRLDESAEIVVLEQSLSGVFSFEQQTTSGGTKVVRIGFTDVRLFLGDAKDAGDADDGAGLEPLHIAEAGLELVSPAKEAAGTGSDGDDQHGCERDRRDGDDANLEFRPGE